MDIDVLNSLVTSAIWRAERLEEGGLGTAALAWMEVSRLEERLAAVLPLSAPEGRIARRGAVRAALKAQDYDRAEKLAQSYAAEEGAPKALRTELRKMLEAETQDLASRFRYAAMHYRVHDARKLARRLHEGGAFGLAA